MSYIFAFQADLRHFVAKKSYWDIVAIF